MFDIEKIKEIISFLLEDEPEEDRSRGCKEHFYASIVIAATSLIMTIQNIRNESWVMTVATSILVIGFLFNMFVSGVLKNYTLSLTVMIMLVGVLFSAFILGAGNEGFACLWVLLVPLVSVYLVGVVPGVAISCYFLIFIIVVFYTPANVLIAEKYTHCHMQRFPVLYACDMVLSLVTALQNEFYSRKLKEKTFRDELTGAYNRNYFLEKLERTREASAENFTVVMMDLNGLKAANDTMGHASGDELLIGFVEICKSVFGKNAWLFRMGGDEFAVVLDEPAETVEKYLTELREAGANWKGRLNEKLEFAAGYAAKKEFPESGPEELMRKADERMFSDKAQYYMKHDRRRR